MRLPFDVIAFDADDTLWDNEPLFTQAQDTLEEILTDYLESRDLRRLLYQRERRNLEIFGYGVKAFTLSMIETAVELSGGRVAGKDIQRIIDIGKTLLRHPVHLLDGVEEALQALSGAYRLWIITKGDLLDQESKVARSGLADLFDAVEIVSEKDESSYRQLLANHRVDPERFLMVGNSPKSDILPVCTLGGHAVWIPYQSTWEHETASTEEMERCGCRRIASMADLPDLLTSWEDDNA